MKILHYYTQYNVGGTEKVIYSILSNLDNNIFDKYFLSTLKGKNDEELRKERINLKIIPKDKKFEKNLYKYFLENKFDIIHVHNCKEMGQVLKIAKKAGIRKRIIHSHVYRKDLNKILWIVKGIKEIPLTIYSNIYFACSKLAAKWLFPLKLKKAYIILDGFNISNFKYDKEKRNKIRNKLNIKECEYVITMVSRLEQQKNHKFMLDVIKELINKNNKYKLLIVGDGKNKEKLIKQVQKYNISKHVIFVGTKNNVSDYLSASDLYVMPSIFEGLGISAVEAQYNGLMAFVSDNIPAEVDIDENLVQYIPLKKKKWISEILKISSKDYKHNKSISSEKYDMDKIINEIEEIYKG